MKKSSLAFILFSMFLNTVGFTIIIPILPSLIGKYSPPGELAFYFGLLMSSYAFCQFLAAPGLGMLSDRFGRRPILLISLIGSIIGYIILGIGGALWVYFLGRIIDGLTGGNISTIYAYVSDSVQGKDRGKYFGYIGAAGGFGFVIGPALGGLIGAISLSAPLYLAAAITFANVLWGFFALKESLPKDRRIKSFKIGQLNPFYQFKMLLAEKHIRWLFGIGLLFFFVLTGYQGNVAVYLTDILHWGPLGIGSSLLVVGLVDIFSQGYLTHKLLPVFGEKRLTEIGLVIITIGFVMAAMLVFITNAIWWYAAVVVLIIGDGLVEPAYTSLLSKTVDQTKQGQIQGANQSMQSFARIIGPLAFAGAYELTKNTPYFAGAIILAITFLLVFMYKPKAS